MAAGTSSSDSISSELLTKTEFYSALASLRTDLNDTIQKATTPLSDKLELLQSALQEIALTAEAAVENAIANQEGIRNLETQEKWAREKILTLENKVRERNLKFRGFEEKAEGTTELAIFMKLKPIATQLQEAGVRYKWLPTGAMQIRHQNKTWTIEDLDGGKIVLQSLRIQVPMECDKKSYKRKLAFMSPAKDSKIPVRVATETV
ncbi:UNVERIFIED_CONTAM: hypothetical protein K2H54_034811 [Gekko kuhli]